MRMRNRRLLVPLGLCLLAISILAVLLAFQHVSHSGKMGAVSDIALLPDRGLVVYSQEACADASRFLPFCNPPNLHYLKTQSFDPDAESDQEAQVHLKYWHTWFGHVFPEFQTSE